MAVCVRVLAVAVVVAFASCNVIIELNRLLCGALFNHEFFCFGKQKPFVLLLLFFYRDLEPGNQGCFYFLQKMSDGFTENLELWTWIC